MEKIFKKDLEDLCFENCPLHLEGMCSISNSNPSTYGVDPPCAWLEDDDEVYDWINSKNEQIRILEDMEDTKIRAEKERQVKNKKAAELRQQSASHVYHETYNIKRLRKKIQTNKNIIRFAKTLAEAFSFANSMVYNSEIKPTKKDYELKLEAENTELQKQIDELQVIKTQKLKEYRKQRKRKES